MVKTGIQLCVYVDESMIDIMKEIAQYANNVKVMHTVILSELETYKICETIDVLQLPYTDNSEKDTISYLLLINSKIEFMKDALLKNVWKSDLFAWIDFSIYHVFKDISLCNELLLKIQSFSNPSQSSFLFIPGCLDKLSLNDSSILVNRIYWRFCGGFFFGNKESILELYDYQMKYLPIFLNKYNTLVWEVNFWAWLEINTEWKPFWYKADHNDSIIQLPCQLIAFSLSKNVFCKSISYSYPLLEDKKENDSYIPGSASYLKYNGKHLLNTRYINYIIHPKQKDKEAIFTFQHPNKHIITKNVFSILNENTLQPLFYQEIKDPIKEQNHENEIYSLLMFNGIEDIRLYQYQNEIYFIGTTLNYSSQGKNSIMKGKYDVTTFQLINTFIIDSPYNLQCEKNWTPIIQIIQGIETEYFIYKWFPIEIGRILNNKLQIEITHEINDSFFKKIRGSTTFTLWGEFLVGVVHFSEDECLERKYFHVLIMLDVITMKPVKNSDPFYFGKEPGIEFCIGFTILNLQYHFWTSRLDHNPKLFTIPLKNIPFTNKIVYL